MNNQINFDLDNKISICNFFSGNRTQNQIDGQIANGGQNREERFSALARSYIYLPKFSNVFYIKREPF